MGFLRFLLFYLLSTWPCFAQEPLIYMGESGAAYELTPQGNFVPTKTPAFTNIPEARINAAGEVEVWEQAWIKSVLRTPPDGMKYTGAYLDSQKNLYVSLGNGGKGFNFLGAGNKPLILAGRAKWSDGELGAREWKQIYADSQSPGLYALSEKRELFHILPPTGQGPFQIDFIAKDIEKILGQNIVQKTNGEFYHLQSGPIKTPEKGKFIHSVSEWQSLQSELPPENAPKIAAEKPAKASGTKLNTAVLAKAIEENLTKVDEFRFIREEAAKLGIKDAYLFGGTASAFAHYVNWDLKRNHGDDRYQPFRFDYDYTNIFRSNQDLDIVIDGSEEQATKLQALLADKFPHFQGSKSSWEVRLLRSDLKDKEAILNNPNFLNQHSDSNSTGLINLMEGRETVKDVRDWKTGESQFIRDIAEGKLHLYFSDLHHTTKRFLEGKNPPIIFAIRALTKAIQYELELRPEDEAILRKVIKDFRPENKNQLDPYVQTWIEKNGKKLIQNAVNIEYAWNLINGMGLRTKLMGFNGNKEDVDSLAWWMNKEPLRAKPLGNKTQGKTAQQFFQEKKLPMEEGKLVLAHETNSFLAYESITRAHTGEANVLISRDGAVSEAAAFGDGFYTKVGRLGARGTGLTIRFTLDPNAIEGVDFISQDDFIIVKNKNAIRVIPESLDLSLPQIFELIAKDKEIQTNDLALFEKMKRSRMNKAALLSEQDMNEIMNAIFENAKDDASAEKLLTLWLELPDAIRKKYDQRVIGEMIDRGLALYRLTIYQGKNETIMQSSKLRAYRAKMLQLSENVVAMGNYALDEKMKEAFKQTAKIADESERNVTFLYLEDLAKIRFDNPVPEIDLLVSSKYKTAMGTKIATGIFYGTYIRQIAAEIIEESAPLNDFTPGLFDFLIRAARPSKETRGSPNIVAEAFMHKLNSSVSVRLPEAYQEEIYHRLVYLHFGSKVNNWKAFVNVFTEPKVKVEIISDLVNNHRVFFTREQLDGVVAYIEKSLKTMDLSQRKEIDQQVYLVFKDWFTRPPGRYATGSIEPELFFIKVFSQQRWEKLLPEANAKAKNRMNEPAMVDRMLRNIKQFDTGECSEAFKF